MTLEEELKLVENRAMHKRLSEERIAIKWERAEITYCKKDGCSEAVIPGRYRVSEFCSVSCRDRHYAEYYAERIRLRRRHSKAMRKLRAKFVN